jgi:hypothetical protein
MEVCFLFKAKTKVFHRQMSVLYQDSHAKAHVVRCSPFIVEAQVWFQVSLHEICVGQSSTEAGFPLSTSVIFLAASFHQCSTVIVIIHADGKCKPITFCNCRVADRRLAYTLYPKVITEQIRKMAGYPVKILVILGEVFDGFLNCSRGMPSS